MSDFGDIEPDDVPAEGGEPDPDQVAFRLHELRAYIDKLAGTDWAARFEELTPEEQEVARAVGAAIVQWLLSQDPDDPELVARHLHAVRRYWSRGALEAWEDLPQDHRDLAVALMANIITWLQREGSLP